MLSPLVLYYSHMIGDFILMPRRLIQGINFFTGADRDSAIADRDQHFVGNPDDLARYADNEKIVIMLSYQGIVEYQNYNNNDWMHVGNSSNYQNFWGLGVSDGYQVTFTSPSTAPTEIYGTGIHYRATCDDKEAGFELIFDDGTGVTMNQKTGLISGGEGAGIGEYEIIVNAASLVGKSNMYSITWTVIPL